MSPRANWSDNPTTGPAAAGSSPARGADNADNAAAAPVARPALPGATLIASADESLLDIIDNLLGRGVLLHGEVVLGLADVDLIYVRLSVLLCAADRVLPPR